MPKTIGELINDLAQKAGVATDDPKLKALLASPELATIQVDDALYSSIDSKLLSLDSAKNNHPDIAAVYNSQFYDSMDKELLKIIEDADFSTEDVSEIKAEPKTRKRYAMAIAKLKEAKGKATGADKDAINAQLTAAHEAARLAKAEVETVKNESEAKLKGLELKYAKRGVLGIYKTIYDELPVNAKMAAMEALLDNALQDKKAVLKTDEYGNLTLVSQDGTSNIFGDNHVQLTPSSFLDKTFAPILKVSGPPKPAATTRPPVNAAVTPVEQNLEANASFVKSHADKVLADFGQTPASMI